MARSRLRGGGSHAPIARRLLLGFFFIVVASSAALAETLPSERSLSPDPNASHIAEASQRFGIPTAWIRAVLAEESAGDVRALSPAGAMGLMQIMPETWAELRIRHRLGNDPYDPRDNILAGAAYLREMHDRFGSPGFLAAYNAGPGRYEDFVAGRRDLPAETRAYVDALAPIVGGGEITEATTAAAVDRQAWTSAPLFVVRPDGASTVDSSLSDGRPNNAAGAASVRDLSAIEPQSGDLFVVRADAGDPP